MISLGLPNQWKEELPTDGANDMEEGGGVKSEGRMRRSGQGGEGRINEGWAAYHGRGG